MLGSLDFRTGLIVVFLIPASMLAALFWRWRDVGANGDRDHGGIAVLDLVNTGSCSGNVCVAISRKVIRIRN